VAVTVNNNEGSQTRQANKLHFQYSVHVRTVAIILEEMVIQYTITNPLPDRKSGKTAGSVEKVQYIGLSYYYVLRTYLIQAIKRPRASWLWRVRIGKGVGSTGGKRKTENVMSRSHSALRSLQRRVASCGLLMAGHADLSPRTWPSTSGLDDCVVEFRINTVARLLQQPRRIAKF
jgi:hypothetical protein